MISISLRGGGQSWALRIILPFPPFMAPLVVSTNVAAFPQTNLCTGHAGCAQFQALQGIKVIKKPQSDFKLIIYLLFGHLDVEMLW